MAMSFASMANPVVDNNSSNNTAGDDDLLLLHEDAAENGGKRTISSSPSAPSTNARRSRTREVASRYMYRTAASSSSSQRYKSPTNNYTSAAAMARSPSPLWGRSSRSSAAAATQTPSSFYASTASMAAMTPSSSSADLAADNMHKKSRPLSADRCRRRPYAAFESTNKTTAAAAQTNSQLSSFSRPSSLTKKRPSSACVRSETTPSFATSLWPSAQPSTASSVFSAIVHHHDGSVSAAASSRHGAQPLHPQGRRFSPQRRASSRVRMSTATLISDHSLQSAAAPCTLRASSTCTMMAAAISSIAAAAASTDQPCGAGGGGSCKTDSSWWPALLPRTASGNVVDATRRASDGHQRSESSGRRRPIEMDVDRHGLRCSSRSNLHLSSSEEARCAPADDYVVDTAKQADHGGSAKSNHQSPASESTEDESGNRGQGSPQFVRRGDGGGGDEDAAAALSDTESTSSGSMISLPSSSDGSRAGARTTAQLRTAANSSSAASAVSVKMRGTVVPARFWLSDSASTSSTTRAPPPPPLNAAAAASMANSAARTVTPQRGLSTAHASAPQSPASPTSHLHARKGGGARTQSPSRALSATSPAKTRLLLMPNASSNGAAGAAGGGATIAAQRGSSMSSLVNMSLDLGKAGSNSSRKSWGQLQQQLEEAHDLRLLHNRWLQWHFVNARAEHARKQQSATAEKLLYACFSTTCDLRMSVTSKQIQRNQTLQALKLDSMLDANAAPLEEWASLQSGHSSALAGVMGALEAAVVRVPISGTKIDIQATKEALCSAVDVMDALEAFVGAFLMKVEAVDTSLSELANTIILEKASLMECGGLLAAATLLETEERSLRAYLMQIEPIQPRI